MKTERTASASQPSATARLSNALLVQHLDIAEMARGVAGPPDAVRIGWIEVDPSGIRLYDRQRELGPGFRLGIEAGDLVRGLQCHPDHLVLRIGDHVVGAIVF